jgi:hypothetical protein
MTTPVARITRVTVTSETADGTVGALTAYDPEDLTLDVVSRLEETYTGDPPLLREKPEIVVTIKLGRTGANLVTDSAKRFPGDTGKVALLADPAGEEVAEMFAGWAQRAGILARITEEQCADLSRAFITGFAYGRGYVSLPATT